jgi:hypothetical protein
MKPVRDEEDPLLVGQVLRRFEPDVQVAVTGAAFGERLELHEQGRHEVEREPHVRELAEQRRHPVVVLQRVQAHPRQDVLPRHQVLVERLVVVPQQRDACFHVLWWGSKRHTRRCSGSSTGILSANSCCRS